VLSVRDPSLTLTQFCDRLKTVLCCRAYETLAKRRRESLGCKDCCANTNSLLTYSLTYLLMVSTHYHASCNADIWELIGTSVHRHRSFYTDLGVYYPRIEFTVYLDRKPLFYVVNIIIPVMFLVVVVLMVLLLHVYTVSFAHGRGSMPDH